MTIGFIGLRGIPFEASGGIVMVACGTLLLAFLLLRSAADKHPAA